MSKQKSKAKPVSSHPLFPLVVAVWFSALLGLGSLAIRPSALEGVVLALQLDTVIPAAAPPLGVTARIVLALALAGLGAVIGLVVGRRLRALGEGRSERRRGPEVATADTPRLRSADAHPDAPVRRPLSAREDLAETGLQDSTDPAEDGEEAPAPTRRRRALAVTDESRRSDFLDLAPLPGAPTASHPDLAAPEPETAASVLDLTELAPELAPELASVSPLAEAPGTTPSLDWSQARPLEPVRSFDAPPAVLRPAFDETDHHEDFEDAGALAAPAFPAQVFAPVTEPAPDAPAAIASMPEAEEVAQAAPSEVFAAAEAAPVAELSAEVVSSPVEAPQPAPLPTPALTAEANMAGPELGALGMVELAERLARAMDRRRSGRAPAASSSAPVAATPAPTALVMPPALAPVTEAPVALAALAEVAPQPAAEALAEVAAEPEQTAPPAEPDDLASASTPAPGQSAAPRFARLPGDAETVAAPAADEPPRIVPAVFRPFDALGSDESDHGDETDGFALPSLLTTPTVLAPTTPPPSAAAESDEDEDAAEAADEGAYSSLLEMSRRESFVRVDDEPQSAAIEPVVIFPGQTGGAAVGAPRLFDPPGTIASPGAAPAMQAGAGATRAAAPAHNAEETELALRAALASLQRMSGAA